MMADYAAALVHLDHQMNRTLDAVEEPGEIDNMQVVYLMGDNDPCKWPATLAALAAPWVSMTPRNRAGRQE